MTTFFPTLLFTGLGLALAPILLHLLNLQRQQPVRWAAMDFLLESQARNKTWINLKQLLLLTARVAALVLAGLMVARPQLTGGLADWAPGEPVHHIVLLDDSYSMTDRGDTQSPWERALSALDALALRAQESTGHRVTLIRSSVPDELQRFENQEQLVTLREAAPGWRPSESAGGLDAALASVLEQAGQTPAGERAVAYLLSDFRRRDLPDPEAIEDTLKQLSERTVALTIAPCVERRHDNLAVSDLKLLPSAQVAGVEMAASVTVTNYGSKDLGRTAVRLWRDETPLPAIELTSIAAGESATRRFPIRYPTSGEHRLQAELSDDPIAADNKRRLAFDLPSERAVLIVDGSGGHEGLAFATALRPSAGVTTGWRPTRCAPDELSRVGDLTRFAAVLLLDVNRLKPNETEALQRYAQQGGGVLLVLGEQVDRRFYNRQLFVEAESPLLPVRLDLPSQTAVDREGRPATLRAKEHPALRVFAGDRASFQDLIRVRQQHAINLVEEGQSVPPGVQVLASLSTGPPILIQSIDHPGRIVCLLTTAARPEGRLEGWSNLSVSPLFPVLVNELTAHLAEKRLQPTLRVVGDDWGKVMRKLLPDAKRLQRFEEEGYVTLNTQSPDSPQDNSGSATDWGQADAAGIYRLQTNTSDAHTLAINVDPGEGDLNFYGRQELRRLFGGLDLEVLPADELAGQARHVDVELYQRFGMLLLLLLLAEQGLAYACSYHHTRADRRAAG